MPKQYRLYMLTHKIERQRRPEELPKGRALLDAIIHKAASEATAGRTVHLYAPGIGESPLLRRIALLHPDMETFLPVTGGKLHCITPMHASPAIIRDWLESVPAPGALVIIHGADEIFRSYDEAARMLKSAVDDQNLDVAFAWPDIPAGTAGKDVRFEAWDEINPVTFQKEYMQQIVPDKAIPVHTPFKVSNEDYRSNPKYAHDPLLLYCPATGMAYKLDPEDPWDRRLLDAFDSEKRKG